MLPASELLAIAQGSTSQADGAAADTTLLLFYDFNDGPNSGVALNKGTTGSDYDLLLGKLPKPAGITPPTDVQDVRYGLTKLQTMHIIPGSVPKSTGGYDTGAPVVVAAAAGESVSITEHGASYSHTAPSPFTATHVASSNGVTIHVVPKTAPTGPDASVAGDVYNGAHACVLAPPHPPGLGA